MIKIERKGNFFFECRVYAPKLLMFIEKTTLKIILFILLINFIAI